RCRGTMGAAWSATWRPRRMTTPPSGRASSRHRTEVRTCSRRASRSGPNVRPRPPPSRIAVRWIDPRTDLGERLVRTTELQPDFGADAAFFDNLVVSHRGRWAGPQHRQDRVRMPATKEHKPVTQPTAEKVIWLTQEAFDRLAAELEHLKGPA